MSVAPCTTAGDLARRAAALLNDAAYERWPQADLLDYMTEALRVAYALRPDISIERRVIQLGPGTAQKVASDVQKLLSVDLNVTRLPDGSYVETETITSQSTASLRLAAAVAMPVGCGAEESFDCGAYRVRSAQIDGTDPRTFFVSPAVPPGCRPEISVTVVSGANLGALIASSCVYVKPETEAALVEWVLYRAYSIDAESQISPTLSQTHLRNFYTLLDNGQRAVSRINADMNQRLPIPSSPTVRYAPARVRSES